MASEMTINMTRDFWKIAQKFPPNKERVYPIHAAAHEFDVQARPCTDGHQKSVLEYGCGGGSDTESLVTRGAKVFFVDIVPENVFATRERLRAFVDPLDADRGPALGYVLERSDALPFGNACFDSINCHGVLHHIDAETLERVLLEMHRVLRPGGHLYAMLYTEHLFERCLKDMERLMAERGWSEERAFGYKTDGGTADAWCIARPYTELSGRALFARAGFVTVSTTVYNDGDFRTFKVVRTLGG